MQRAVIIFVRNPELGKVKTRLAAAIGAGAALYVYKKLLTHTLAVTQQISADKFVFYAGAVATNDIWQGADYYKLLQEEGELGVKMRAAFLHIFNKGYEQVVIVGSDCPHVSKGHLDDAFCFLQTHDVVIGPAGDGGYYLLGLKKMHGSLFINKQWSTPSVFLDTVRTIEQLELSYKTLQVLTDVDEEKDLPEVWKREVATLFNLA